MELLRDDAPAASLRQAAARSMEYLEKLPADRMFIAVDRTATAAALMPMLRAASQTTSLSAWARTLCTDHRVYHLDLPPGHPGLLVTGYYQPELRASRTRTERFRYPLYRTPEDLVDVNLGEHCPTCKERVAHERMQDGVLVPYYSRAEIDAGVLDGHGYELAWLDDPVEAFFLHVQGSALLRFDDGVHLQISYSSSNGRPYTSIGRVLVAQGKLSREVVSLQALKDYLHAHPDEQAGLMAADERYIFFRSVVTGPIGSLGVPLTAGRSIAADASVYPPGALAFLRIRPRDRQPGASDRPVLSRFVLIQDAGAAITGVNRLDVFYGTGAPAEAIAGDLRNPGELYVVLPQ